MHPSKFKLIDLHPCRNEHLEKPRRERPKAIWAYMDDVLEKLSSGRFFRPRSLKARFLSHFGLPIFPTVRELLELMLSKDDTLRTAAMTYFIENYHANGYCLTDLSECRNAFLPLQGSTRLATPSECFTNEEAAVLGFNILRRDLHDHANKFGVARDPPMAKCVKKLLSSPPQDQQSAVTLFGYFASRMNEVEESSVVHLRDAPFVPVSRPSLAQSSKTGTAVSHISPCRAYLGFSATYDGDIFDFVDFGKEANAFLFHCGAKSEPTKLDIAHLICNEPARLLRILKSPKKYMDLLRSLSESSITLNHDKELWRKLKTSPCLLAFREVTRRGLVPSHDAHGSPPPYGGTTSDSQPLSLSSSSSAGGHLTNLDENDAPSRQYQLASASQIVVLGRVSYRPFEEHLLYAPEEDLLENFYLQLGALKLSSIVQEDVRIGPHTGREEVAEQLRKHVLERSEMFLIEHADYQVFHLAHHFDFLANYLLVKMVRSITLTITLRGQRQSHTEKRSAAASAYKPGGPYVLYIAEDCQTDMYQVGQLIGRHMLLEPTHQVAFLLLESFLTLDLCGLRARGYDVNRVLRAKAAEARDVERDQKYIVDDRFRPTPSAAYHNFHNAADATRPHGSDDPYSTTLVHVSSPQQQYCDCTLAQSITLAGEASNKMKVFAGKKEWLSEAARALSANRTAVNAFSELLVDIGSVYWLRPEVLHVFYVYDHTVAFNTRGSIFFNLHYFLEYHARNFKTVSGRAEAATWWWVVLTHQLAHNLVPVHNKEHTYYTETFIKRYMGRMMHKLNQMGGLPPAAPL